MRNLMRFVFAIGMAVAIVLLVYTPRARAQKVEINCAQLGVAIMSAGALRDVDANVDKVLAASKKVTKVSPAAWAVIEREVRRMWKSPLPADQVGFEVYKRCQAQLGDMGRDS